MLYVGSGMQAVSPRRDTEPALVDPMLEADLRSPDRAGAGMGYWPAYASIPAACRGAYLEWLAGGRCDPDSNIGYVFLFLYGVERRLLYDGEDSEAARSERPALLDEVRRLRGIYAEKSRSFRRYSGSLLTFFDVAAGDSAPSFDANSGPEALPRLAVAVGALAATGTALPAEMGLLWVEMDPQITLRTAGRRCIEEFRELFLLIYRERFPAGVPMRACKRTLRVTYYPASSSFAGQETIETGLPDTFALVDPRRKLAGLADECCTHLDAFSRHVGKHPDGRESLAALALLPANLANRRVRAQSAALQARVADAAAQEGSVTFETLLAGVVETTADRVKKKDVALLARVLEHLGFGLEPDVRFGGPVPSRAARVVVFRLGPDAPNAPTAEYTAAAQLLQLAVMVTTSDGDVSPAERDQLGRHVVEALHLSEAERMRLDAHLRWLLLDPPGWAGIQRRLQVLEAAQRDRIGAFLVQVALADGRVEPAEIKVLTRLFRHLGLDPGAVHDEIHRLSSRSLAVDDEPVSVRPASPERSHPIPPRPVEQNATPAAEPALELDMDLIASRLEETASVSALLASVFVESEDDATAPSSTTASPAVAATGSPGGHTNLHGLDVAHTQLLLRIGERPRWARADYEALAAELEVLPDGAIDRINDIAIDVGGACLCEDDDPIAVDLDLHARLTTSPAAT